MLDGAADIAKILATLAALRAQLGTKRSDVGASCCDVCRQDIVELREVTAELLDAAGQIVTALDKARAYSRRVEGMAHGANMAVFDIVAAVAPLLGAERAAALVDAVETRGPYSQADADASSEDE